MLSEKAVNEFKAIYLRTFGELLDDQTAREYASSLVNLYKAVYGNNPNISMRPANEENLPHPPHQK